MTRFITAEETQRLRGAAEDSIQKKLYDAMRERVRKETVVPGFLQPGDTQLWWHLCWERASNAAFIWHMERDQKLGEWLKGVAFWMRDLSLDEWIGPWFRNRKGEPCGALETAHVCLAMCDILDLCGELFTEEELTSCRQALKEKGMPLCLRFCETRRGCSNWYNVILMGYGVSAFYLEDTEAMEKTLTLLQDSYAMYNRDSYGETVQYSNYASLTLARLHEIILRLHPEYEPRLNLGVYASLMEWYAASHLYMKPWSDETVYPRIFNFGDCGAVTRPDGDVLVQVSVRMKQRMPREAALASWLFETTYAHPEQGPDELSTFGFYNQYRYHAVLMQPDMAKAKDPEEAMLPEVMKFANGDRIIRDTWHDTKAAMAIQAGSEPLNVTAHRHEDQGSIQFAQGMERMIIDGGHCSYRLEAQRYTMSSSQHATFDFLDPDKSSNPVTVSMPYYKVTGQYKAQGHYANRRPSRLKNEMDQTIGDAYVLTMDMTDAYPEEVVCAKRTVAAVMPHAVFIIDAAKTSKPMALRTHFPMNNRDGALKTHIKDPHKLVFRRGGEAMKVFECLCLADGEESPSNLMFDWGYCHRNYHPLPNQEGQGKEGSAEIYDWADKPALTHIRLCAIASEKDGPIVGWHIKPDGNGQWYIESPEKKEVLRVRIVPDGAFLVKNGQETRILTF